MSNVNIKSDLLDMFGLTPKQSLLMFSTEKMIAEYDTTLSYNTKSYQDKLDWINEWERSILKYLQTFKGFENAKLYDKSELIEEYNQEIEVSINKTWFYISALECLEFTPYTALGDKGNDKKYSKLKYNEKACDTMLQEFYVKQGYLSQDKIERFYKTYNRSLNTISGKTKTTVTKIAVVVGVAALFAALAAIGAGPIAVAIFGEQFVGLGGAALVNACLAMAGGGAIAAGGVALISGGGALLGLAVGSSAEVGISMVLLKTPDYTLTLAAKLETVLKEVILNSQQDVVLAQSLIAQYQEKINELNKQIDTMELQEELNKKEIKLIKESLNYMKTSCKNMSKFTSSYEIGLKTDAE